MLLDSYVLISVPIYTHINIYTYKYENSCNISIKREILIIYVNIHAVIIPNSINVKMIF